ncbi:hypothetical protein DSO57_1010131 [Entomophthora muscae]|uniref:Uncharacterized protein n=1 Tax=Entomophthora muscae TaxID=34485 RepID=A0ACC2TIH1_9FUNG|nr:hypothetical protein DSO57_1010131 [Entomophthora muscae]
MLKLSTVPLKLHKEHLPNNLRPKIIVKFCSSSELPPQTSGVESCPLPVLWVTTPPDSYIFLKIFLEAQVIFFPPEKCCLRVPLVTTLICTPPILVLVPPLCSNLQSLPPFPLLEQEVLVPNKTAKALEWPPLYTFWLLSGLLLMGLNAYLQQLSHASSL